MLSKFLLFPVVVLVAGTWAVLDSPCAVAESTTFKEVPQKGTALTPDVLNAFKAHIVKFWLPPPRPTNPEEVIVRVRFSLSPDGSLAGPPKVMTTGSTEPY